MSGVNTLKVDLVDKMGSDLTVVNAARVSFAKKSNWDDIPFAEGNVLKDSDARLIKYLAKHNHWSPFAHASLQFRIKAPIFVARQLVKHQVGLVWNEISRRYVDSEPEFYVPKVWRKRPPDSIKQGSDESDTITYGIEGTMMFVKETYQNLLNEGVEKERIFFTGNIMIDSLALNKDAIDRCSKMENQNPVSQSCPDFGIFKLL